MKIGCPKEIKDHEYRVGLTPNAVHAYVAAGHEVMMEAGAGQGSSITDEQYAAAGAKILPTADEVWAASEMIVKVKEPMPEEYSKMRESQLIYTYFHFASSEELTRACMKRKIIALAYETVKEGVSLPLLKPMSEVAGRMSAVVASYFLAKPQGGRGLLPMGVTGLAPSEVLIVGGGVVGTNAARAAAGLGADVKILDINLNRLEYLSEIMPSNVLPLYCDEMNLEKHLKIADIVIGAVLIPGAVAPKLITKQHIKMMKPGSVIVDVAIDQGGCCETSRPTSHSNPTYVLDDVIHYCVSNMPGAYARTATFALNNATISYGLILADKGVEAACRDNYALNQGLNMYKGIITYKAVADAFGLKGDYKPVSAILG